MGHDVGWEALSQEEALEIARRYALGETFDQLYQDFRRDIRTLRRAVTENGGTIRSRSHKFLLSPEQARDIAQRYDLGATSKDLAQEYGVSASIIRGSVVRAGSQLRSSRSPSLREDEKHEIIQRYSMGATLDDLCKELGRGKPMIREILSAAGIKIRPRGYGKGRGWTQEWRAAHRRGVGTLENRERARQSLISRLPAMESGAIGSPIEQRLWEALLRAGISFRAPSRKLDRYLVDIEIIQKPVLIEADGWAFHNTPDQRKKDQARDEALRADGYRVFRFWGKEINRDSDECISKVVTACGLVSESVPVYEVPSRYQKQLQAFG